MSRRTSIFLLLGIASSAPACLWDSDTIAYEAKEFPDVVDVATGRFDRNPPLFYQMRLDRVTKELKADPAKLDDYDDAAVACDRLGRDDEALAWMAKKRKAQTAAHAGPDVRYRTLANEGTFYAHKWFRAGQKTEQFDLLDMSIADLNAAIKLNPNAHFGREIVQVKVVQWLRDRKPSEYSPKEWEENLSEYLDDQKLTKLQIRKGLCGLVVLGNAWESPDVFAAIADTLPGTIGTFVDDRARELNPKFAQLGSGGQPVDAYLDSVHDSFKLLRKAADEEEERRKAYMMARLQKGDHPDADTHFWDDWRPTPRPAFIEPPALSRVGAWFWAGDGVYLVMAVLLVIFFAVFVGLPYLLVSRILRRVRAARAPKK